MDYRLRETTRDPAFLLSPSSETSSNMETLISVVTRKLVQSTQCSQKLVPSFAVVQERAIFPRTSQWGYWSLSPSAPTQVRTRKNAKRS